MFKHEGHGLTSGHCHTVTVGHTLPHCRTLSYSAQQNNDGAHDDHANAGLGDVAYWGSWFATHWATLLASGALCTLVATYPFAHTSSALLLLFFALFTASTVCFR